MKVQKLGLVLGINMAAACLMMQGCKATKPGRNVPPPQPDRTITVVSRPTAKPVVKVEAEPAEVPEQKLVVTPVAPPPPPPPVVQPKPAVQPKPSAVATVKPLPAVKAKPAKDAAAKKAAAVPAGAAATEEYIVKPGDTLFLISKRTNIRQRAILAANPDLKADRLRVGQKIKLPVAAPAATAVAAAPAPKSAEPSTKAADKKADEAKVMAAAAPVSDAAANTKAPAKTKSAFVQYDGPTKEYVVKSGDSLGKIAYESGITIRALKAMNGLTKDNLRIGQKLKIPAEKQVAAAKPAVNADAAKKVNAAATVPAEAQKPGDAAKKKDAAKDVAAKPVEGKKPAAEKADEAAKSADAPKADEAAKPAEKPAAEAAPKDEAKQPEAVAAAPAETATPTHVVKEGEDLVTIAIMYAISPSVLMDLNNIGMTEQDKLKPGTVLKLPAHVKVPENR